MARLRLTFGRSEPGLGVDFGATSVKAAALGHDRHGLALLGAGREPVPEGAVAAGVVRDPEQAGAALSRLLQRMEVRGRLAALSLGGPSVFVRRFGGVPPAPPGGGEGAGAESLRDAVAREAARHLPFHIEDMEFDYQRASPAGGGLPPAPSSGDAAASAPGAPPAPESPVVFAAAPRDTVRAHREALRVANREAARIEIEPYALFAALRLEAALSGAAPGGPPGWTNGAPSRGGPALLVELGSSRAAVHLFERPPRPLPPGARPERFLESLGAEDDPGELLASAQVSWAGTPGAPKRRSGRGGSRRAADAEGAGLGHAVAGAIREALRDGARKPPAAVRLTGAGARLDGIGEPLREFAEGPPTPLEPLALLSPQAAGPEYALAAGLALLRLLDSASPARGRRA